MKAIFLRAVEEAADKDRGLRAAIASPEQALGQTRFDVEPATFSQVPRSPFAYWTTESVRNAFCRLPALQQRSLLASGTGTLDDFRFLRLSWEVFSAATWIGYAKGGAFAPHYFDHHLTVNWSNDGEEMKAWIIERYGGGHWARNIRSTEHYFRPGLTWPRRTQGGLSTRVMPSGCIFADKGPAAFVRGDSHAALLFLLAVMNSRPFRSLVDLQMAFGSYEVGVLQRTPVPDALAPDVTDIADLARKSWSLKRGLDTRAENSHAFHLPGLLQVDGDALSGRSAAWAQRVAATNAELARLQAEIDDRCFGLYGIGGADREQIERGLGGSPAGDDAADAEDNGDDTCEPEELDGGPVVASLLSWSVGVAFGRFDLRLATGERPLPSEPEPFDPLPVCSPGMLTGEDGQPLDTAPAGYAIDFPREGILLDDAGTPRDLVASARQVFEHVFDDPAARWDEAADILGQRDRTLRRWFARDFFGLHLKQYSKSRRKAPIYWPLSTASGSYTVWLYYPRLNADTLFQVVAEHLEPKLRKTQEERLQVDAAQGRAEGREAAKLAKQAGELAELEQELEEMKAELLRVAELPYKPNLNDGVQITAAPLAKLFQLKAWRKILATTWKNLEKGEYDWAHLAHAIWPDRVRDKCKTDRSLAIAHDLESLCEVKAAG